MSFIRDATNETALCASSIERMMIPGAEHVDPNFVRKSSMKSDNPDFRNKSAWGTTVTTIRATRRFSHQRPSINANGDPPMPCVTSGPPSPRYGTSPTNNVLLQ